MYFNYTKYIPIVPELKNINYFCQGNKIQNTLNVFQIHITITTTLRIPYNYNMIVIYLKL